LSAANFEAPDTRFAVRPKPVKEQNRRKAWKFKRNFRSGVVRKTRQEFAVANSVRVRRTGSASGSRSIWCQPDNW
jgi:hypothetical protein